MRDDPLNKTPPARQGFYEAVTKDGHAYIAEWRSPTKSADKRWWQYVTDDPTVARKPVPLDDVIGWRPVEKSRVDKFLERELTTDERIDAAYKQYGLHKNLYDFDGPAPPPERAISVGDEIEVGNLKECVTVRVLEEGRVVVYSHRPVHRDRGREIPAGIAYQASHWTSVVPLRTRKPTQLVREPALYGGYFNSGLSSLLGRWLNGLNDNPDYQRGYTWTLEDKQRYLASLFAGRELGRFMFVQRRYPERDEVLDGKQRMQCLTEFFTSRLAFEGVYWHELSARDRSMLESRSVQYADLPGNRYSRADLLAIFLEVNAGGVPQTEEHLAKVRTLLAAERAK